MFDFERTGILSALEERANRHFATTGKPFVTISYAQSLNGAIAGAAGQPVAISCREALVYTHQLRSLHDGILVGVQTVLADDPALTTRLVEGDNPRRIILDSTLRIPESSRVLQADDLPPLIVTTPAHDAGKARALEGQGAQVVCLPATSRGWVNLRSMLPFLGALGIQKIMVEGGGHVIASFLQDRCVDHFIVTLSMMLLGGQPVLEPGAGILMNGRRLTRIQPSHHLWMGTDLIIHGDPVWNGSN